ncbi:MAG: hypothetical protein QOF84_3555 [Streptomyces sp.]|nr:hypothetical protein [Streptomyces sp.]
MDLSTVEELVPAVGATWQAGDAFLAGGSWLFSQPQPDVRRLLDLHAFDWPPLVESDAGLEIAATCTLATVAAWRPPARWPAGALARRCCEALLGSFKVQNTATVGGNICLALPAGPMTSLAASLGGVATLWSPDGTARALPVVELVTGVQQTALRPGELLRSVLLPAASLAGRAAMRQYSLSTLGRSAALVIGLQAPSGEIVLTVTASTPRPVQVTVPGAVGAAVGDAAADAVAALDAAVPAWHDDVHGDPAWRAAITRRMVAEVVGELSS